MPRLFVAIDLPAAVKDRLLCLRAHDLPPARWTRRDAMHLTLHFIGDTSESAALRYARALEKVSLPAFDLEIGGVGQFPPLGRPRVIWAGVANTPALRALHEAAGARLQGCGFRLERRRYHPHITLMRFKKSPRRGMSERWLRDHADLHIEAFPVGEFALYESQLRPGGAVYSKRAVYALDN